MAELVTDSSAIDVTESDKTPLFLLMGPVGGNKNDLHLPQYQFFADLDWTSACCEAVVGRFLAEARYFLQIHNVVVQHFMKSIPFQKHMESDADRGNKGKKRDSFLSALWNAQELDRMVNPPANLPAANLPAANLSEAEQALAAGEEHRVIEKELAKSFQSVRDKSASKSSINYGDNILETSSVQLLLQTPSPVPDKSPSLFARVRENFKQLLDEELSSLRTNIKKSLPNFLEKNTDKLCKLSMRAHNYIDLLDKIKEDMKEVIWPSYTGGILKFIDLREEGKDDTYHVIYAPGHMIVRLENICIIAYGLFEKTYDLEKKLHILSPREFDALQEEKRDIVRPTVDLTFYRKSK